MPSMCRAYRQPDLVEQILGDMQGIDKPRRGDTGQATQHRVQHQQHCRAGVGVQRRDMRHQKRRLLAEEPASHERRCTRRDRDRQERVRADLRHHQLDGEHHAADRRIERGRDAGSRAGRHQRDPLTRRHADDLPQCRTQRRADLNDRALAARPTIRCRSPQRTPAISPMPQPAGSPLRGNRSRPSPPARRVPSPPARNY